MRVCKRGREIEREGEREREGGRESVCEEKREIEREGERERATRPRDADLLWRRAAVFVCHAIAAQDCALAHLLG